MSTVFLGPEVLTLTGFHCSLVITWIHSSLLNIILEIFSIFQYNQCRNVIFGHKRSQIISKWDKSWNFNISFMIVIQNVLKADLHNSQICPIQCQFVLFWSKSDTPVLMWGIDLVIDKTRFFFTITENPSKLLDKSRQRCSDRRSRIVNLDDGR